MNIFRKFIFVQPTDNVKKLSVVFVLHGSNGNGNQMLARVPAIAKASNWENFIAVFPFGYNLKIGGTVFKHSDESRRILSESYYKSLEKDDDDDKDNSFHLIGEEDE